MLRRQGWVVFVCLSCVLLHDSGASAGPKAKAARAQANEKANEKSSEQSIIQAIQKLGGTVGHEGQDPQQPVVAVVLAQTKFTTAHLKMLADLPKLNTLILNNTPLDDAGLALICQYKTLEVLDLQNTAVTDAGLASLRNLPGLRDVHLTGSATTEKGVTALRKQFPDSIVDWYPPLPKLPNAEAYFKLGEELVLKGQYIQGIRSYSTALMLDPKYDLATHSRAWAFLKIDDPVSAKADFEKFIKVQPKNGLSYAGLGMTYYLTGELEKAGEAAEKSLKLDANCANAYYVRGMIHFDRHEFEAALPNFEHAVELEPKDAANHERLGWTYLELKFYENALTAFDDTLKLDPEFEHAYYGRGLYWMAMKKPAKALEDLAKALKLDPTFPDYAVDLALAQATVGDFKAAAATQAKVLEIAADEDKPTQQARLKAYLAKRLPDTTPVKKAAVESAAKPGAGKR